MEEKYTFSCKLNKSSLRMITIQFIGGGLVLLVGAIMFYGSYMFYAIILGMILGIYVIYMVMKSQKDEIIIDDISINLRKRIFKYSDYEKIIAREYKDQIVYILGQKENKKTKEIILRLGGLALDSNELLMRLKSFTQTEIEKV